jgi:hypothetical protein
VNADLTRSVAPEGGVNHGIYQVAFDAPGSPCPRVTIATGWFRVCQLDTLTIFDIPGGSCTVADRVDVPSAIFVETRDAAGVPTDLPFTLHVSR